MDKSIAFWKAAGVRAVRTMAQTALSLIGVGSIMSDVDWIRVGSASALAGILSVLTSIAWGIPEADQIDRDRPGSTGSAESTESMKGADRPTES